MTLPVRAAHARLAAIKRHRPDDARAIREAKRATRYLNHLTADDLVDVVNAMGEW